MIHEKNSFGILASVISAIILAGCGGGGGGSSGNGNGNAATDTATPASGASSPAAASSSTGSSTSLPTAASSPTSASAPASASSPAVTGEALPSLASPQAGSTAATGSGPEGIWTSASGIYQTIAFIDPSNNVSSLTAASSFVVDEFYGVVSPTATSWTLTSGLDFTTSSIVYPTTSGSGTYVPKQSFTGSYTANNNTTNIGWTYNAANALSVNQQSVAGTWSQTGTSMTITSDGSLTGSLSGCNVSGSMLLATAGSNQNLYTLTMSAAAGTSCAMPAGLVYTGTAAILFLPITGSNGYQRTIAYSAKASDNVHIAYGQLAKQ